jgi:peptide-methionine (S)-S-oxide reductase
VRTRVGYAGGTTPDPTYRSIGDHTESLQVDFDPAVISYDRLLAEFWRQHEPCEQAWSRQYQAILFHGSAAQEQAARRSALAVHEVEGRAIATEVRPLARFYLAEDYHQKYALRRDSPRVAELRRLYPTEAEFRDAPATAKINAWCHGDLPFADLKVALARLGLEAVGRDALEAVRRN